ncbi:MAG: AI-2E family transporter [Rhodoferax sp.]|nr:AI-2E family transporter [Rhodoferax sp.]
MAVVLAPFVVSMLWAGILAFASWRHLSDCCARRQSGLAERAVYDAVHVGPGGAAHAVACSSYRRPMPARSARSPGRRDGRQPAASAPCSQPARRRSELAAWLQAVMVEPMRGQTEIRNLIGKLDTETWALVGGGQEPGQAGLCAVHPFLCLPARPQPAGPGAHCAQGIAGERTQGMWTRWPTPHVRVVYGIVLTAIVQGLGRSWLLGAGLPAPATLAAWTVLIALIPFGTPVVWGSAGLWLLFTGQTTAGIGLLLWGVLVVSWVDNIVRPMLLSRGSNVPFILACSACWAGGSLGLVGLFLGPVILAVALAVWREWL